MVIPELRVWINPQHLGSSLRISSADMKINNQLILLLFST